MDTAKSDVHVASSAEQTRLELQHEKDFVFGNDTKPERHAFIGEGSLPGETRDPASVTIPRSTLWRSPAMMLGFFIAATGFSLGHHFYNSSLNGQAVSSTNEQEWALRYGTAFAFLVKTCFAASVGIAYGQHIWTSFAKKAIAVNGLDAAFSATSSLLSFLSREFLSKIKLGATLALFTWLLSLSALITPATLSVVPAVRDERTTFEAPIVDFTTLASLATFGASGPSTGTWDVFANSPILSRTYRVLYMSGAIPSMEAVQSDLPVGAGYQARFSAPLLKCRETNSSETAIMSKIVDEALSDLEVDAIQYMLFRTPPKILADDGQPNEDFDFSSFMKWCIKADDIESPDCSWYDIITNDYLWIYSGSESWACHTLNATLSANFTVVQPGVQNIYVDKIEPSPLKATFDGTNLHDEAPTWEEYTKIFNYIMYLLDGYITVNNDSYGAFHVSPERTTILESSMMASLDFAKTSQAFTNTTNFPFPSASDKALIGNKTLGELVEEFSLNLTLSTFSVKQTWSTVGAGYNTTMVKPISLNIYSYSYKNLVVSYATAFAVSLLSIMVGMRAYVVNGAYPSTPFSAVVLATRNPTLDAIIKGHGDQRASISAELGATRLRYGILNKDFDSEGGRDITQAQTRHLAFGVPEEITPLIK